MQAKNRMTRRGLITFQSSGKGRKSSVGNFTQFLVLAAVIVLMMSPVMTFGGQESAKIKVVATIFPFADWAARIGGDRVDVVCLLPPGASQHTYELSTKDVKLLQQARLLVCNGSGLDDWAGKLVERSANKELIRLALAESLPLAPMPVMIGDEHEEEGQGEHEEADHHGHDHTIANCGMWLDPMRAVHMIDSITQTLGQIDPEHREYYQQRAKSYWAQLDRLDREYRRTFQNVQGGVICLHDDLIYLFRRYNVEIYGIVEPYPGKEPSLEYMRKLTDHVAGKNLLCVITEPQLSLKPASVLADQLKVPLVTLDPIGGKGVDGRDSYIGLMTYNLRQLAKFTGTREPAGK